METDIAGIQEHAFRKRNVLECRKWKWFSCRTWEIYTEGEGERKVWSRGRQTRKPMNGHRENKKRKT